MGDEITGASSASSQAAVGAPTSRPTGGLVEPAAWLTILLLAILWRLMGVTTTEVWRDEAVTILHTQNSWLDLVLRLPHIEDTPPLGFLLFKAWAMISRAEWALRLLPILLGVAWVDLMMRTARTIEPRAWWTVGLLAAFSPVPIHYSQEIRVYALLALLTAAGFYAAERVVASRTLGKWLFAVAGLSALAGHAHLAGLFLFPTLLVYLSIRAGRGWIGRPAIGPVLLWLFAVAPLIWFARYWSSFHRAAIDSWWIPPLTARRAIEIAERFLGLETLGFFATAQQTPAALWTCFFGGRVILAAGAVMLALGLLSAAHRRTVLALLGGAVTFLAALLVSGYVSLPNVWDRTALPAWTPLILALGVAATAGRSRPVAISARSCVLMIAAIWSASWAWNAYCGPPRRPINAPLFERIRAQIRPQDLVYTWPRWYKDLTVYRLGPMISADQLLDEYDAYRGSPPRPHLAPTDPDDWRERVVGQIRERREAHGKEFNVWIVHGTPVYRPYPGTPEEYIVDHFHEAERYEFYSDRVVGYVRYVPSD